MQLCFWPQWVAQTDAAHLQVWQYISFDQPLLILKGPTVRVLGRTYRVPRLNRCNKCGPFFKKILHTSIECTKLQHPTYKQVRPSSGVEITHFIAKIIPRGPKRCGPHSNDCYIRWPTVKNLGRTSPGWIGGAEVAHFGEENNGRISSCNTVCWQKGYATLLLATMGGPNRCGPPTSLTICFFPSTTTDSKVSHCKSFRPHLSKLNRCNKCGPF